MEYGELLSRVQGLETLIREHSAEGERERRVPKATAEAIRAAGLLKVWVPRTLGGDEMSPVDACRAMEAMARIDSAAGWMFQMCSAVSLLLAWFDDEGVAEICGAGVPVVGDSFAPAMAMERVSGGFRIRGQASFVSNCHHIDWYMGLGFEYEGDQPKTDAGGSPLARVFAVPRSEFEIVDNWDTLGMRGTGSHDVRVDDVFVPDRRAAHFHPIAQARNEAYGIDLASMGGIWLGTTSMAAVCLGIARAAEDAFLELCHTKTPNYHTNKVGDTALTAYRLGEAHAYLDAARAYLYGTLDAVWSRVRQGVPHDADTRRDLAACGTFATQSAGRAVELLSESAGTSTVREHNALARHRRDLQTLTQHVYSARNRYEDIGALTLGRAPAFGLLEF